MPDHCKSVTFLNCSFAACIVGKGSALSVLSSFIIAIATMKDAVDRIRIPDVVRNVTALKRRFTSLVVQFAVQFIIIVKSNSISRT